MPLPYSEDLRHRIVWLSVVHKATPTTISRLLHVSSRTVTRYVELFNRTGDVLPRTRRNGPHRLLGQHEQIVLLRLILESPGIFLYEVQRELYDQYGLDVSTSTICRTLRFMGCSRQRIQRIALQRSDECRARFMAEISMYDPEMLVWIDETGCDRRNSLRRYGYSIRGMPPRDYKLLVRGTRYSAIPVLSLQGIHDVQVIEGTVNGEKIADFIEKSVVPILQPFNGSNPLSVVIMDNCSIHHVDQVSDLIENTAHAKLLYLPPYSPDLMPLEEVFNQVKCIMKQNCGLFQACSAPRVFLIMAFSFVSVENCIGYIRHSGYIH